MAFPDLPEIYFIRHGETEWNAEGRYQGQKDIPLNAVGQAQADANGVLLRQLFDRGALHPSAFAWYASPMDRTRETMARVRAAFDPPLPEVDVEPELRELSFGKYEGRLWQDLADHELVPVGERLAQFWDFRPEGGESYADAALRLRPLFSRLRAPSIIVAHGGIARVFRHLVEGVSKTEAVNWVVPQDAILHFAGGRLEVVPSGLASVD